MTAEVEIPAVWEIPYSQLALTARMYKSPAIEHDSPTFVGYIVEIHFQNSGSLFRFYIRIPCGAFRSGPYQGKKILGSINFQYEEKKLYK